MMFPPSFSLPRAVLLCLTIALFSSIALAGDDWKPIDPADLASKTPVVEKDADAEALFWEVRVDDGEADELIFTNYVRVKVFTERGKESQSKIDLPYRGSYRIKDIAARTVKADGTIVELKKDDVFERTLLKMNGVKVKAKSFAMPAVEPGAIVEYRWREIRGGRSANYVQLQFQRDIPVRNLTYLVRPYSGPYANGMSYRPFHMPNGLKFEKVKDGFYRAQLSNVAAFHEEPRMPPEDEVRSWILLYYTRDQKIAPDKYWSDLGKGIYENSKDEMKVNDDVRKKAAEIVGDASTADEKLKRIYEFCHVQIKNYVRDESLTPDEKAKFKANKSPADTLKRGIGTGGNIDSLFAALSTAAGFEAHLAISGNRQNIFLDRDFTNPYFLDSSFIAVKVNDKWQFLSPAEYYTPYGMLRWLEEGQNALIISKEPEWVMTPMSSADRSVQKSVGKFRLLEDGTLEGEVRIEYTGQLAMDKKYYNDDDSPQQREDTLRAMIKERMSTAELTNVKIENVTDPAKPFTYDYHIRVSGYAQRTGKRLFLQPAFFEHGVAPLFSGSDRRQAVYFHYPWREEEEVTIALPEGYALDSPDAPAPFSIGATGQYKPSIGITKDGKDLIFKRSFFFCGGDAIIFPLNSYGQLKLVFDRINKEDNHTITLKQNTASASN